MNNNVQQYSVAYRPRKWEEVFGQDKVVADLKKRIITNNIPKAILLQGPFGTGKTTIAEIFAAAIQAHLPDGNPDWTSVHTKSILEESFNRDTIRFDGASLRGVDDMDALQRQLKTKPMYDPKKVVIIEEADQLSATSMKSLLKVLEDPNPYVVFILLSMEDKKGIPASIQSRCQVYSVKPVDNMSIMMACKAIMEKTGDWQDDSIPDSFKLEGLATIAECARGSLRSAMQYLEMSIIGQFWTKDVILEQFATLDENKLWQILDGLLVKTKDENIWRTLMGLKSTNDDDGAMHAVNYMSMMLAEALLVKETGIVYEEKARDRLMKFANNPNTESLYYCLTLHPAMNKPFLRTTDLIGCLMAYYQGMDFKPKAPILVPTVQDVNPIPQTTLLTTAVQSAEEKPEPIPTRAIPTRQRKAEAEPKVTIGTPNYRIPIGEGVLPKDIVF